MYCVYIHMVLVKSGYFISQTDILILFIYVVIIYLCYLFM